MMIAYILVRDNLDVLHMPRRLKDLTQHVLGHPLVQSTHVKSSLVGLGRRSSEAAGRGQDAAAVDARSRRRDGRRDWVRVLRNMEGRRGEMSWVALAVLGGRSAHTRLRRRRNRSSVSHCCDDGKLCCRESSRAPQKGVGDGGCRWRTGTEEKSVERRGVCVS